MENTNENANEKKLLPDIQMKASEIPISINRVGAKGIKKLVLIERGTKRPIVLISVFDVFINLLSEMKGANLSRNFEAVDEVIEEMTLKPVKWIEELAERIAEELLHRHNYATRAEVNMSSELILRKRTPVSKNRTQEVVKIFCKAIANRNNEREIWIGVELWGITACPCAQELIKAKTYESLKKAGFEDEVVKKILRNLVLPTHNQRGKAEVWVRVVGEKVNVKVPIEKLIEIARAGMSCEIYELLKREDEVEVVERAHKNPLFVEDSVRRMAEKAVEILKEAPDSVFIILRQENEESIHQHSVFAEIKENLGVLRNIVNSVSSTSTASA